ncbi:hypothetical protein NOC27_1521 [Nitrosococcus oceani AFC27]|nr:hypothetical protein NOC27_1521 [Nitrosococcus oceani AFC27]
MDLLAGEKKINRLLTPLLSIRDVVAPEEPEGGLLHQHHRYN